MAEFPALPLWTDAYLADTAHLRDGERGRYDLMLFLMWRMPQLRFPNDDAWLGRKFGRSAEVIEKYWKPLMREFFRCDGNWWTHKRLTSEFEYVRANSQKQSVRAKGRWQKEKDECHGNAQNSVLRNAPTPTPTPTPHKKDSSPKPPRGDFDGFWISCPRKVGKGAARKAYARALLKTAPETLLDGIQSYGRSRAGEPEQFTVHPATWLNAERWLDQMGVNGAAPFAFSDDERREEQENLKRMGLV